METSGDVIGQSTLYGGSLTACGSGLAYVSYESQMLILLSALGTIVAVAGLVYTVWNSNRNYRLAREQLELQRQELLHGRQG